jgi:DNA-binding LacI/PurR family transcriptional regulator
MTVATLRAFMQKHGLTYADVAQLAGVSVKTVESWLADPNSAMFRRMPPRHLSSMAYQLPGLLARRKNAARSVRKRKP